MLVSPPQDFDRKHQDSQRSKFVRHGRYVTLTIALSLLGLFSLPANTLADPPRLNSYIAKAKRVKYTPPPSRGTPQSASRINPGAGSRGDCQVIANRPPLTRLVGSRHLNQTVSPHPAFGYISHIQAKR